MFAASSEPSADPAPTSVCNSSIKMMQFWLSISSFMMVFRRSSNCPRYLVPATINERSSPRILLSARNDGTSPSAMRWASPSTIAVLPTPGSPISTGLFLVRRQRICITRSTSPSRPTSGSSWLSMAACVKSRENSDSREDSRLDPRCGCAFSWVLRASSSRMALRRSPRSCRISAAKHFSSRSNPSSRCSVPMCLWLRRSASSAAYANTRLHSLLKGRSTEVETFSRIVVCPSICLRMDSTDACERRKRLVNALSSRNRPSSRCSVSIYGEPNWLASYLAKKITRLAFSVYRSNIFPSPRCSQSPLPETSLSLSGCDPRPHQKEAFLSCQRPPSRGTPLLRRTKPAACHIGRKTKTSPFRLALIQLRGRHFLGHAVMQSQYAVTAAGKLKVVGDDKGSKPVFAMKSLHQAEYHFRGPVIQIT